MNKIRKFSRETKLAIIVGIITIMAVSVCIWVIKSQPSIKSGTVIDKIDIPAHYESYTLTIYAGCLFYSKGMCTVPHYIYLPQQRYVVEGWKLVLSNGKRKGSILVSQSEYNSIKIGDNYGTTSSN